MSEELHRNRKVSVVVADEALASARYLTSWPCDDEAFVVQSEPMAAEKSWLEAIIDSLALGAATYYPGAWLHAASLMEEERTAEARHAADLPSGQSGVGFCATLGRAVLRLWS